MNNIEIKRCPVGHSIPTTENVSFPDTNRNEFLMKNIGFKKAIVFVDGIRVSMSVSLENTKHIDIIEIPADHSPLLYYGVENISEVLRIRKVKL